MFTSLEDKQHAEKLLAQHQARIKNTGDKTKSKPRERGITRHRTSTASTVATAATVAATPREVTHLHTKTHQLPQTKLIKTPLIITSGDSAVVESHTKSKNMSGNCGSGHAFRDHKGVVRRGVPVPHSDGFIKNVSPTPSETSGHPKWLVDVWPELEPLKPGVLDFLVNMTVTKEEIERIKNVEQREDEWHRARANRITASNYGGAIGQNKYTTPDGLIKDMLWKTFKGNRACEYGTHFEDVAELAFKAYMAKRGEPVEIDHCGLIVLETLPFIGMSPDGLVTCSDGSKALLEIKCPYGAGPKSGGGKVYDTVPPQYQAQIQGLMGFYGLSKAFFVVWTQKVVSVREVNFDPDYFNLLRKKVIDWYTTRYVPALLLKQADKLLPNQIEPVMTF